MRKRAENSESTAALSTAGKAGWQLDNFARAFRDEAELRDRIATLLRKMGRQEVRIAHGRTERGKDIVFYGPSGIDDRSLYACVVKKGRIVGDVANRSCAQAVFRQAEQALRESYRNPSNGQLERVKAIYVMSPYEPTADAIASIAEPLSTVGNVEFVCGTRLLDLFGKFWSSFLLFESSVMVSYLSALRSNLQLDKTLIELVLRQSILANSPAEFETMYVPQDFGEQVVHAAIDQPHHSLLTDNTPFDKKALATIATRLNYIHELANYMLMTGRLPVDLRHSIESIQKRFSKLLDEDEKHKISLERERFSKPSDKDEKRKISLAEIGRKLVPLTNQLEHIRKTIIPLLDADCITSNKSSGSTGPPKATVRSEEFMTFCRLRDLEESVPGTITFDQSRLLHEIFADASFFEEGIPLMLLVGPAGFGKTSFCKWQALSCATNLLTHKGNTLPVYVPLSKFASSLPSSHEAFFESSELRQLLTDPCRKTKIQLLLDGLDEIPDEYRQNAIIELARSVLKEVPDCQIIVTARDHIRGAWLAGTPRLRVKPLNDAQQWRLVQNWLGSREAADVFFEQLPQSLSSLMGAPLLATLTAAVYKKNRHLPRTRTALYTLFVELLCGGLDAVKGTNRGAHFGIHDKRLVLTRLAGMNHFERKRDASSDNFKAAVKETLSGLVERSDDLLEEVLTDGLLITAGANLRFSHLSFQEFLAAEDLREPDNARARRMLESFFRGDDWWTEVLIFYITGAANPADMEKWLIARATASTIGGPNLDRLDERLRVLRKALRAAFPEFRPQYPEDSGWQGWLRHLTF